MLLQELKPKQIKMIINANSLRALRSLVSEFEVCALEMIRYCVLWDYRS